MIYFSEEQFHKKFKSLKAQMYTAKWGGKSGDAAGKEPLWCLQEMLFLDDHLSSRATVTNIPVFTAHSVICFLCSLHDAYETSFRFGA